MKKLFLTVIVLTKLFCVNAQNVSVNYTRTLSPPNETILNNGSIAPQMVEQFSLGYSQNLLKSNLKVNFAARIAIKEPPWYIPCPQCTLELPKPPKGSKAAVLGFANPQTLSLDLLVGLGYTLPHKAGSRLTFSVNVDGGVSINKDQEAKFTYDGKVEGTVPVEKYQTIIMPSLIMRVALSKRLGINLGGGYSNIGGMNLTTGLSFNVFPTKKKDCLHWECCGSCRGFDR